MKKILSLALALATFFTVSAQSAKKETFKVLGNCGMCKKTIEKAAKTDGVTKAIWSPKTKVMTVVYDPAKISVTGIQKRIAAAGYDSEKEKAPDAAYNKLPGCCKYDRSGKDQSDGHAHLHK